MEQEIVQQMTQKVFDPGTMVGLAYLGQALMAGLGVIGGSIGLGALGNALLTSIARQPELEGNITRWFFIVLGIIEGLAIIVIALSFVLPTLATGTYEGLIAK